MMWLANNKARIFCRLVGKSIPVRFLSAWASEFVTSCAGEVLTGWRVFPLELKDLSVVDFGANKAQSAVGVKGPKFSPGQDGPVVYR